MARYVNILLFNTVLLVHSKNSQPSSLKVILAIEHCKTSNSALASLKNSNSSVHLSTDYFVRRLWSSVNGTYSPWIAYKGCFDILVLPYGKAKYNPEINVETCFFECQRTISCGQNEPILFALKINVCLCICGIQELQTLSRRYNESYSSDDECDSDNFFNVYTEYGLENTRPSGFCLLCSKANLITDIKLSTFGCEPLGLCAEKEDVCYGINKVNSNLNNRKSDCTQQLPFVCQKENGRKNTHAHEYVLFPKTEVIVGTSCALIVTSVVIFLFFHCRKLLRRRNQHQKSHEEHERYENLPIHLKESKPGISTSNDPNPQNAYQIIDTTTRNNCRPEDDHYYDHMHRSERENENHYEKVL